MTPNYSDHLWQLMAEAPDASLGVSNTTLGDIASWLGTMRSLATLRAACVPPPTRVSCDGSFFWDGSPPFGAVSVWTDSLMWDVSFNGFHVCGLGASSATSRIRFALGLEGE